MEVSDIVYITRVIVVLSIQPPSCYSPPRIADVTYESSNQYSLCFVDTNDSRTTRDPYQLWLRRAVVFRATPYSSTTRSTGTGGTHCISLWSYLRCGGRCMFMARDEAQVSWRFKFRPGLQLSCSVACGRSNVSSSRSSRCEIFFPCGCSQRFSSR